VLTAETDYQQLQEARRDLERNLSDAQSQLNTLMNRDASALLGTPATTSVDHVHLSLTRLRTVALAQRPSSQTGTREDRRREVKTFNWRTAHGFPDPALMVKGQRYNDAAEAVSEARIRCVVTVPWVNPSKYSAGVREARASLAAAEQDLSANKGSIAAVARSVGKVETFHHHVELFRDKLLLSAASI